MCQAAIGARGTTRTTILQTETTANIQAHRNEAKRAKLVNKKNKKLYKEQELEELQDKFKNYTSRTFYEGISKIRAGFRPKNLFVKMNMESVFYVRKVYFMTSRYCLILQRKELHHNKTYISVQSMISVLLPQKKSQQLKEN